MGSLFFQYKASCTIRSPTILEVWHGGIMREFQSDKLPQKENTNHEETFCDDMNLCHLKKTCNTWTKNRLGRWYDFLLVKVPWQMLKVCLPVTLRTCFCGKNQPGRIQSHPKTVHLTAMTTSEFVTSHNDFIGWCFGAMAWAPLDFGVLAFPPFPRREKKGGQLLLDAVPMDPLEQLLDRTGGFFVWKCGSIFYIQYYTYILLLERKNNGSLFKLIQQYSFFFI